MNRYKLTGGELTSVQNDTGQTINNIETNSNGSMREPKAAQLMSNKVFIPWYKRYMNTLPENEQMEFQPYEEIDRRDEDIAMQFVYGDNDWPEVSDEKLMKSIRRQAVNQYQAYKERMEKRELLTRGAEGFPKRRASYTSEKSSPSVDSIIQQRKAGNKLPSDFDGGKITAPEIDKLREITAYLNHKRQLTRRKRTMSERKEAGFSVWGSNWSLLLKPKNRMMVAMIYRVQYKANTRLRFRRMINLVFACNRFIYILAEISGDTGAMVKNIRDFQLQQVALIEQNKSTQSDAKFIFEPSKFKLSTETPVSKSVLFTLTKPWYERKQTEVNLAIKSLQILRCFAELPVATQRNMAMVAWFISVPEDKVMIRQAQEAQDCYLLLSGRVSKTVFVGEAHGEQPGLFKYMMSYNKDSIFGEEALTKPGSERSYSVTSCVKCDMLSINVHDYWSCTMMPSDVRSSAPDHIKFISKCNFLNTFPKTMLIEDAENNLYLAYFRPGIVIETNMSDALWMYVVKWGSCRALCEVPPSRKVREEHYESMSWLQPGDGEDEILMQDRMTEPLKQSLKSPRKEGDHTRMSTARQSLVQGVKYELRKKSIDTRSAGSDKYSIVTSNYIEEVKEKKRNMSGLLRAKRKQTLVFEELEKEKEKEKNASIDMINPSDSSNTEKDSNNTLVSSSSSSSGINRFRLPSIYRESLIRSDCGSDFGKRPSFSLPERVNEDANIDKKYKDGKGSEYIIGTQYKVDKFVEKTCSPEAENEISLTEPLSSLRGQNHRNTQIKSERREASFEPSIDNESAERHRRQTMLKKKSRVSIDESLAAVQINKARMHRSGTSDAAVMKKKEPRPHSLWKLKKNLKKGDQIGFEFIDLLDGNFRQPDDTPSLVSDGCELVLIRKAFIVKHMGMTARLDNEFGLDKNGDMI